MPQPASHGILGPRSGPRAHAYMASSHTGHAASYGMAPYGTPPGAAPFAGHGAPYGAPYSAPFIGAVSHIAPPALTQSWDTFALAQHFTNLTRQPPPPEYIFDSGATTHLVNNVGIISFLSLSLSLSPHPVYCHVTIGDGSSVPISSSGHASFPSFSLIVLFIFAMFSLHLTLLKILSLFVSLLLIIIAPSIWTLLVSL
jgi:hypothetical protein